MHGHRRLLFVSICRVLLDKRAGTQFFDGCSQFVLGKAGCRLLVHMRTARRHVADQRQRIIRLIDQGRAMRQQIADVSVHVVTYLSELDMNCTTANNPGDLVSEFILHLTMYFEGSMPVRFLDKTKRGKNGITFYFGWRLWRYSLGDWPRCLVQ